MTEPRLRELRLVGFKSFAEATRLEFGSGISAVVGPNGSGKSNLADALRWALGEQGRSLRTRKSEDVIFAGSARRHATGMADVSLVIDNGDRLLPVEYGLVECGRRLYRSGENEYLLNRQKVRLRDVVDLLDAANLADNAFLFIGQGMVDQALSLRPEERRPLFEEAAGVRRHERRRRQAEERLAEAEANLARVRDILGELRPQARRLAAQAEQQAARRDAGSELAEALVAAGRARWLAAATTAESAARDLAGARTEIDAAMRELTTTEEAVATLAAGLGEQAEATHEARRRLDLARAQVTEARLTIERLAAAQDAAEREAHRAEAERAELEIRIAAARRTLALPAPTGDTTTEASLVELDGELAAAVAELARAEASRREEDERSASLRRARQAREAEVADLRRRATEATRQRDEAEAARREATAAADAADARRVAAEAALTEARRVEEEADRGEHAQAGQAAAAEARAIAATGRAAAATERAERLRARLAALDTLLEAGEAGDLWASVRRRGGRRLAEGLEIDPNLRTAVEAALGTLLRAPVTSRSTVLGLEGISGQVVIDDTSARNGSGTASERLLGQVRERGGGRLVDGVRRDPGGHVLRLLAMTCWLPTLDAAVEVMDALPPGWRIATLEGGVVSAEGVIQLGAPDPLLERQAERERLLLAVEEAEAEASHAQASADELRRGAEAAVATLDNQRQRLEGARADRRGLEELAQAAARGAEATAREAAWATAQAERLAADAERAEAAASGASAAGEVGEAAMADDGTADEPVDVQAWRSRVAGLRERRQVLAAAWQGHEAERRRVEDERRRAEVASDIDVGRLETMEREAQQRAETRQRDRDAAQAANTARSVAEDAEAAAATSLDELEARDSEGRRGLVSLEAQVATHRERLRRADERARSAEMAEVEARLALDNVREALLVELAALGATGLAALDPAASINVQDHGLKAPPDAPAAGDGPAAATDGSLGDADDDTLAAALEGGLDVAISAWTTDSSPSGPEAPTAARLGLLRRRYHDLGASNPFAAEEYAEVRDRLADLEAQQADLSTAIATTRTLIDELSGRITEQFLATFRALEDAFARRFEQLFDGGAASLDLTDPEELSQTGVEIMARPPGKKRQPLAMLSGGERALTAVALLFAMLEVRPVPFCVLDEVDAALDEANVSRFAGALRELARSTQFVVITHNRGTIEAADALYGVTIGEDAVSRVISLRLAEATELVAAGA